MVEVLAPTVIPYAHPELAARTVPRLLDGSEQWCQGFSEPGSGSDLASLRTRAAPRGADWVIDGQKVWTSLAQFASCSPAPARATTGSPPSSSIWTSRGSRSGRCAPCTGWTNSPRCSSTRSWCRPTGCWTGPRRPPTTPISVPPTWRCTRCAAGPAPPSGGSPPAPRWAWRPPSTRCCWRRRNSSCSIRPGSYCRARSNSPIPIMATGSENSALSAAMIRSHGQHSISPPAMHRPCTAAIDGLSTLRHRSVYSR